AKVVVMQRYKVTVEYLGSAFNGFQAQVEAPTVQVELEKALRRLVGAGNASRVVVSSRTDAGVHAMVRPTSPCHELTMPVGKCVPQPPHSPEVVRNAMNSFLRDHKQPIVVRQVEAVSMDFHSRFHARGRDYLYQIYAPRELVHDRHSAKRSLPSALFTRDTAWHVPVPLDIQAMSEACEYFVGKHDFTSFRGVKCQALTPVKTLDHVGVEVVSLPDTYPFGQELQLINVEVSAPSFLYHMVRNIVGALVEVGRHKLKPQDIERILHGKSRQLAPRMAPAHGLYLKHVKYDM
ncbi:hypothetical protein B5M09_003904, partial [Aphanomyces astaci]